MIGCCPLAMKKLLGISHRINLWYRTFMIWIILFLPLSVWLGIKYITLLNIPSVICLTITLVMFMLVELRQVLRDRARLRTPLWVMCLSLVSILVGVIWK